MSLNTYKPRRLFTVEQANAMLPLVRAIAADAAELAREIVDRRQRLERLGHARGGDAASVYGAELAQIEKQMEKDERRLAEYVDELTRLGVEPKGLLDGLVDFPARREGRVVYLCWKLGEPAVRHWHELDAGFLGRQELPAETPEPVKL